MKNTKYILDRLKSPFVILMIGPPLCGKSTIIKEWTDNYNGEITIISRDAILLSEYGGDDYSEAFKTVNQKNVDKILIKSIKDANDNKENVIIDMTNLSSKRRKYSLSFFDEDYTKVAVVLDVPKLDELFRRNENRLVKENKFIPEHVIVSMVNSFATIKDTEGFDKIISL
jgi:predicted kinase